MLDIPYVKSPKSGCALACYTMVAKYFFPETTFDQVSKISNWIPGYVVWAFKFWLWIMDKGITIKLYEDSDYRAWANEGLEGLRKSVSAKEFEYYTSHTKDIDSYPEDIRKVLAHPNFTHEKIKPAFEDLVSAFRSGAICELTLDSHVLDGIPGFAVHRVVVVDITPEEVVIHDPRETDSRPARRVEREHFIKSSFRSMSSVELCTYKRAK